MENSKHPVFCVLCRSKIVDTRPAEALNFVFCVTHCSSLFAAYMRKNIEQIIHGRSFSDKLNEAHLYVFSDSSLFVLAFSHVTQRPPQQHQTRKARRRI